MDFERRDQIHQLVQISIVDGQTKEDALASVRDAFGHDSVSEEDMDVFYAKKCCCCFMCSSYSSERCSRLKLPFEEPPFKTQIINRKLCDWEHSDHGRFYGLSSCLIDDRYMLKFEGKIEEICIIDTWLGKSTFLTYKHSANIDKELSDFDLFGSFIEYIQMINNEFMIIKLFKRVHQQRNQSFIDYAFGDSLFTRYQQNQRPNRQDNLNRHARRRLLLDLINKKRPKKPVKNEDLCVFLIAKLNIADQEFEIVSKIDMGKVEKKFNVIRLKKPSFDRDFYMLLQRRGDVENEDRRYAIQTCRFVRNSKLNFELEMGQLVDPAPYMHRIHLYEGKFYAFDLVKSMTTYVCQLNPKKIYTYELEMNLQNEWKTNELVANEENGMGKEISKEKFKYNQSSCWHKNHFYTAFKFDEDDFLSLFVLDIYTMIWKHLELEVIDWVSKISVDCNENLVLSTSCRVIRFFHELQYSENSVYRFPTRKPEPLFQLTFFEFYEMAKDNPVIGKITDDLPIVKCILKDGGEIGQEKMKTIPLLQNKFSDFLSNFYEYDFE